MAEGPLGPAAGALEASVEHELCARAYEEALVVLSRVLQPSLVDFLS